MVNLRKLVNSSVPQASYLALQTELDNLRDDHLMLLRRDIERKVSTLNAHEQGLELRQTRGDLRELSIEYEKIVELYNRALVEVEVHKASLIKAQGGKSGGSIEAKEAFKYLQTRFERFKLQLGFS